MSIVVVIAGIKRSGTTWMANAVRMILEENGYDPHFIGYGSWDPEHQARWHVIKEHRWKKPLSWKANFILTSDRPDEGIRQSWRRFKRRSLPDANLGEWRKWLREWKKRSHYHMAYENLLNRDREVIGDIAYLLDMEIDPEVIKKRLDKLQPPTDQHYDPDTMLIRRHFTRDA